jgi:SLBB domain/Polysaccharide biosynthesis/export protein
MTNALSRRTIRTTAFILLITALAVGSADGQEDANRALATRQSLQALLASGTSGSNKLSDRERKIIEERLVTGDFQIGDRLIIRVLGDSAFRDTLAVRAGQEVALPNMPPLRLAGLLRSELQDKAREHIAQFIRDPQVQATALVRIGVLGSVTRPGYYTVAPEKPLSEALMAAGGLTADAELKKASIRHNGTERFPPEAVRQAMAQGVSLDEMGLQGGDELTIGRRSSGFGATVPIITGIASIAIAVVALVITNSH